MEPAHQHAQREDKYYRDYEVCIETWKDILKEWYVLDGEIVGCGDEGKETYRETQVRTVTIPEVIPRPKH